MATDRPAKIYFSDFFSVSPETLAGYGAFICGFYGTSRLKVLFQEVNCMLGIVSMRLSRTVLAFAKAETKALD